MPEEQAPYPPSAPGSIAPPQGAAGPRLFAAEESKADLAAVPAFLRDRAHGGTRPSRHLDLRVEPPSETGAVTAAAVAALPMAGLPPRRLVVLGIAIVLTWMVASFGRQVTEASAATARADQLRAATAALAAEVAGLEDELQTVQSPRYIDNAARAYRLGTAREIAFALEVGAPPLGPAAPGSASVRLGAETSTSSPLDRWFEILFGPSD